MARPSPFYILDEVEAALDDANLGRLLGVFEKLRASSQLIVITPEAHDGDRGRALRGIDATGRRVCGGRSARPRTRERVTRVVRYPQMATSSDGARRGMDRFCS
jgi:chromosome segregation protein